MPARRWACAAALLLLPVSLHGQQVRLTLHRDSAGVVVLTQELLPVSQTVCPVPAVAPVVSSDAALVQLLEAQQAELTQMRALLVQQQEAARASLVERATPWAAIMAAVGVIVTAVKK